jgi:hypothetical protein
VDETEGCRRIIRGKNPTFFVENRGVVERLYGRYTRKQVIETAAEILKVSPDSLKLDDALPVFLKALSKAGFSKNLPFSMANRKRWVVSDKVPSPSPRVPFRKVGAIRLVD